MATSAKTKSNGAAPKGSKAPAKPKVATAAAPTPSPSASGAATPLSEDAPKTGLVRVVKPDKKQYDAEQAEIRSRIEVLQEEMKAIQNKINAGSSSGPGAERRAELRAELDRIKEEQGKFKNSRGQLSAQLKTLDDGISKKIKDLQAARGKTHFKSVADVDAHIRPLEKQVESGTLKLVDEKRALAEISNCKRLRRTVEGFQADQESLERDKAQADELRKQYNDPEATALSDRFVEIKAELDQIKKEGDEFYADRNRLFDERNDLKAQLDKVFNERRDSQNKFRDENERYWAKVNEDRARRAERAKQQREAEEEAKRNEIAQRIREEAALPAYQSQIEDCQTLIDYLSGKTTGAIRLSTSDQLVAKGELSGVPKLEIRQVEANTAGLVARKKKGEDEETYFVGGKGKKSGRKGKGGAKASASGGGDGEATSTTTPSFSGSLNIPLPTLTALLSLSIQPPTNAADLPRVISDLQTKKAWFEANQDRTTEENKAKADAEIQRLLGSTSSGKVVANSDATSRANSVKGVDTPLIGTGESPPEPTPTPADAGEAERAISPQEIEAELEEEVVKGGIEITA